MKGSKNIKTLDEIGFIGTQTKKAHTALAQKEIAAKTKKAMDDYRSQHLNKKKVA